MILNNLSKGVALAALTTSIGTFSTTAQAFDLYFDLYTGEKTGAYYNKICPAIKKEASQNGVELNCKTSSGSIDNLEKVLDKPNNFGLSQFDQFALKYSNQANQLVYTPIHDDIGSECLFMVTKNKLISNFGDVVASAPYLNFILPPEKSGHAGTFKYLQSIDPNGLGKAAKVSFANSTEDAITQTLTSEDNVTLFVQTADPKNALFTLVNKNKGHFVPVISKEVLGQTVKGTKVYKAQETAVSNPKWHKSGTKVITSCTPIMLFTGKSLKIQNPDDKKAHEQAIAKLTAIPAEKLRPQQSWFSKLWNNSKALSAKAVEGLVNTAEEAKKVSSPYLSKAKTATEPYVEKAKDVTKDVIDAAKPTYDAAKEQTKKAIDAAKPAYDAAKEQTQKAIDAAKPALDVAKEKTKEAYEAAKPTLDAIKEKTEELGKKAYDQASDLVKGSEKAAEKADDASRGSE